MFEDDIYTMMIKSKITIKEENPDFTDDYLPVTEQSDNDETIIKIEDSESYDVKLENFEAEDSTCHESNEEIENNFIKEELSSHDVTDPKRVMPCSILCRKLKIKESDSFIKPDTDSTLMTTSSKCFQCEICQHVFINVVTFNTHLLTKHGKKIVNRPAERPQKVNDGARKETPVQCTVCDKFIACRSDLQKHQRAVHDKIRPFACGICQRTFSLSGNCKKHERTHCRGLDGPYKCDDCDRTFSRAEHRNKHCRIVHQGEKRYECEICGKRFSHSWGRTIHVRTHTSDKPFKCEQCDKKFTTSSDLRKHGVKHNGAKPFQCSVCNKKFAYRNGVKHHMMKHTGDFPQCKLCFKEFASPQSLKSHYTKYHSGKKPFQCLKCGDWLETLEEYKAHYDEHVALMPYQCAECNHGFRKRGDLMKHQYIHLGYKPHKCDICGQGFSRSQHRKNHLKTHHNIIV